MLLALPLLVRRKVWGYVACDVWFVALVCRLFALELPGPFFTLTSRAIASVERLRFCLGKRM